MRIAIIGTGYVGLVTGTCFAETGNNVICVDNNTDKVNKMQNGVVPIYEPELEHLFERNTQAGRLHFTTDLKSAVEASDIIFLALPTPPGGDGSADLSYILGVAAELSNIITSYKVIVDKSTVPVGTSIKVHDILAKNLSEDLFDVVSNPEFLREGVAVEDFMKPDRVVIGTKSPRAQKLMRQLYEPFVRQGNPIYFMDEKSAEMTKYAANSYLATRISFMNEIANLCERVGANVDDIRRGIGSDLRIGKRFLFPGVGYGGSCFPKDVKALAKTAEEYHYDFKILKSVMEVNRLQQNRLVEKVMNYFGDDLRNLTFAVWGLAFKPNTDDIREAPALHIIQELLMAGAKVKAYDPEAMHHVGTVFKDKVDLMENPYLALENADALLIVTEWNVFRTPDFEKIGRLLNRKVIFDGRNIYDLEEMGQLNFYYESIGRRTIHPG
jgi:UDPglucose 6-dehydrogenase